MTIVTEAIIRSRGFRAINGSNSLDPEPTDSLHGCRQRRAYLPESLRLGGYATKARNTTCLAIVVETSIRWKGLRVDGCAIRTIARISWILSRHTICLDGSSSTTDLLESFKENEVTDLAYLSSKLHGLVPKNVRKIPALVLYTSL